VTEPAHWGLRRRVLDQLDRVHLARPTTRLYELALATKSEIMRTGANAGDGLPLPPARLRAQAGPRHADAAFFLRSGRRHAGLIRKLLQDAGSALEEFDAILDFGCGCGRVMRHWAALPATRVHGCDVNPKMVEWCRAHLPFVDAVVNDASPPLPHESSSLDLVYAFSVFTHLTEEAQKAWIRECFRVLKPEGYLLLSTLGEHYLSLGRLTPSERASFLNGELVVLYEHSSGTSLCSAYHPPEYVRLKLAADFELVSFLPADADGRHDFHLFRKPASTSADS
jgi:SAM-dependent methyltransferase